MIQVDFINNKEEFNATPPGSGPRCLLWVIQMKALRALDIIFQNWKAT